MRTLPGSIALGVAVLLAVAGCEPAPPEVEQWGAMREVMRDGRTEARIGVAAVASRPHAYAVGALEELGGEVTIVDGAVWVTRVEGEAPRTTGPSPSAGDQATLLTVAYVDEWHSVEITEPTSGAAFESFVERTARASGVDTSLPFPFVVDGDPSELAIHVINGYCPMSTDPGSIDAEPWRWSDEDPDGVTIVGFHAPKAAGVMTHHGTAIHAHAIVTIGGETVTGHIDSVRVSPGMTLRVPGKTWPRGE